MSSFNDILLTITAVIGVIGGISLLVAGVLIMNISLISVSQRRSEIGLLKALGASKTTIKIMFIAEASLLVTLGSIIGLAISYSIMQIVNWQISYLHLSSPWWADLAAIFTALICSIGFSWLPASRAANVEPVMALRGL